MKVVAVLLAVLALMAEAKQMRGVSQATHHVPLEEDVPPQGLEKTLLAALSMKVTPGLTQFLGQLNKTIADMENQILGQRGTTQTNIWNAVKDFEKCTIPAVKNYTQEMQKVAKIHADCRDNESRLVSALNASQVNATQANPPIPPSCKARDEMRTTTPCNTACLLYENAVGKEYFTKMRTYYAAQEALYDAWNANCTRDLREEQAKRNRSIATQASVAVNATNQRARCNAAQRDVDRTSCDLLGNATAACGIYNRCYNQTLTSYAERLVNWQKSEDGYKVEWESIQRLKCMAASLGEEDDNKRKQRLKVCRDTDYSAQAEAKVKLDYGQPTPKKNCALPQPTAGTSDFKEDFFKGVRSDLLLPDCTAQCCPRAR